jgi:transposase
MKTNRQDTKNNKPRKQQETTSQQAARAAPAATRPDVVKVQSQHWARGSAQALSAAQFRAELKAQQLERLLARADQQAEEAVDAMMGTEAASAAGSRAKGAPSHRVIKLGIDVHLERYVVVRQIDGGAPQPAQRFDPAQFLQWAKKQSELAEKVYSCYEAGPFGYSLHRKLTGLGLTNYVVRPRDWDEYGQKVKTDKRDGREMVLSLDRYVGGNDKAFCVVRVPSEAEEQARSRSRQRESLQKDKQRLAAQGRSHALYYGAHLEGEWWQEGLWKGLVLPPIVLELLGPLRRLIQAVELELQAATKAIAAEAPQELPVGLGELSYEILEREICDWDRFKNRRQVASYTGMCPREDTSDQRRFQGSINKHGNPRMRTVLVEASWRLIQFQPDYKPVAKWRKVLADPKATKSKRKQIAVAIGRQFSVDWWRVRTDRCKAQDLGLKLKPRAHAKPTKTSKTNRGASAPSQPIGCGV